LEVLAQTPAMEKGKTLAEARSEMRASAGFFEWCTEAAHENCTEVQLGL